MTFPAWFGLDYPNWNDLLSFAGSLGIPVEVNGSPRPGHLPADSGGPLILIPETLAPLARHWALAHELGHALRHGGPIPGLKGKQETQANHWGACALIPLAHILHHQNASPDAMIAALSAHYEDIPYIDCAARRLAARIGKYRLEALEAARG